MPVYAIETPKGTRAIDAQNVNEAIRFVFEPHVTALSASAAAKLIASGVTLETVPAKAKKAKE